MFETDSEEEEEEELKKEDEEPPRRSAFQVTMGMRTSQPWLVEEVFFPTDLDHRPRLPLPCSCMVAPRGSSAHLKSRGSNCPDLLLAVSIAIVTARIPARAMVQPAVHLHKKFLMLSTKLKLPWVCTSFQALDHLSGLLVP